MKESIIKVTCIICEITFKGTEYETELAFQRHCEEVHWKKEEDDGTVHNNNLDGSSNN